MRQRLALVSILLVTLLAAAPSAQAPQAPAPAGGSQYAGRWEILMKPPTGASNPFEGEGIPYLIVDIAGTDANPSAKVVDTMGGGLLGLKLTETSAKEGKLVLVLEMSVGKTVKITMQMKRVADRLEGDATAEGEKEVIGVVGKATTADKMAAPKMRPPSPDQKAFSTAVSKPPKERTEALKQFLKDYPTSAMKEQATLQLARSYQNADEKIAALKKFIEDFPKSTSKDQATIDIALAAPTRADRAAALKKLIEDTPKDAPLRQQAEYQVTLTITDAAERDAAQEAFAKANPKSTYTSGIYRSLLDSVARRKPLDEARLASVIEGYLGTAPATTMALDGGKIVQVNGKAAAQNTVADRLMVNEVMLDKALSLIQEAVKTAGDKEPARTRGMYTTTLGQVFYKMKDYARAETELKKGIELSGPDESGEGKLYLGKTYEAMGKTDEALTAYFAAAALASDKDTKTSLERMWTKKNGSLAGLDAKLDEIYKAKPKPFEPGHYTPDAAKKTGRVVLAELFTGAECPPCVAADLAFDGLAERYSHAEVAVLVYHMHIPGPDPMTNADTESRGAFYGVNSTPTFSVDGLEQQSGGGGTAQAAALFNGLKTKVESRLAVAPRAALTGFKAKASGKSVKISGQAALLAAAAGKVQKATLRVALVQDMVRYTGGNGVRFHSFVVRQLVGPPAGTPLLADGKKTKFSGTVDVAKLSQSLDAYLAKFEKDRTAARGSEFAFSDRVAKLDPKTLLVVAFVQDDQSKEILQSVFVAPAR